MSCCAPCSAGAIRQIYDFGFMISDLCDKNQKSEIRNHKLDDFCVLFYNPNIFPESEYQKRLCEQIKLCESLGVKYFVGAPACAGVTNYDAEHKKWLNCVRGLENEPERGRRCAECFKMRTAWGARWAAANGYNALATVFGVSRHKDQAQVDAAANAAISDLGFLISDLDDDKKITYLPINWKTNQKSEILNQKSFYRQNYCGCEFSIKKLGPAIKEL